MTTQNMDRTTARAMERLGITQPPSTDLEGLRKVYRAWCLSVPFDNIRKMTALATQAEGPLPGSVPEEFLASWVDHNAGGTCWNTSNALFTVLQAFGFDVRRGTGSMFDMGIDNHGTIIVRIDGESWLVDSSMLTMEPLPLRPRQVHVQDHAIFKAEIDPEEDGFYFWTACPPFPGVIPCRILELDVPESLYHANYERSREMSPFNDRLYARRNFEDRLLVIAGGTRFELGANGMDVRELTREELLAELKGTFGYSEELIQNWVDAGCVESTLRPREGEIELPPITRIPPSARAQ